MTDWVERKRTEMYKACIFDLDGTLADTNPLQMLQIRFWSVLERRHSR